MLDKLNGIFAEAQRLEIQPTEHNVTALAKIFSLVRELAGEILQAQERIRKLELKTEGGDGKTDPEDGGPEAGDANG